MLRGVLVVSAAEVDVEATQVNRTGTGRIHRSAKTRGYERVVPCNDDGCAKVEARLSLLPAVDVRVATLEIPLHGIGDVVRKIGVQRGALKLGLQGHKAGQIEEWATIATA